MVFMYCLRYPHFNPRSRMGSDAQFHPERLQQRMISIHAPAWGATPVYDRDDDESEFQSTLPHGERQYRQAIINVDMDFNPRSRMGSDRIL